MVTTTQRDFQVVESLTLKDRNTLRKSLEADGWTVKTFGSNKRGWTVQAWRGEAPYMIRSSFDLLHGSHTTTPMYRRADGNGCEYADGTPEYP